MAILKKTKPLAVPTIAEIDPHYAELEATEGRLREQERAAQRLVDDIHRHRVNSGPAIRGDRIAELMGEEPGAPQPVPKPIPTAAEAARNLAEIKIALSRVIERKKAVRNAASATICKRIKPHVVSEMAALAKALAAAHEAHFEISRVIDALEDDDVSWTSELPNAPATSILGFARDSQSRLTIWFREAVKEGVITEKDIPEVLR